MNIKELKEYVYKNTIALSRININIINDFDLRVINNVITVGKFELPGEINSVYKLLLYMDDKSGMCNFDGCGNKKKLKSGRRWILNDFCSKKCADLNYSVVQTNDNTSGRMTAESKMSMRKKLSQIVKLKIKNGTFVPGITNSWANSRINIIIDGREIAVRSSWEAFFYLLNPNFMYENIVIKYFDDIKLKHRNYIVDFCDPDNRILYEIKPKSNMEFCINKENAANEWCKINGFSFIYIDEDWLIKNYSDELIKNQPEYNKISSRIKKSLKRY